MTNPPDLDERWVQLVEAVRVEFWRWPLDPDAVFEPNRECRSRSFTGTSPPSGDGGPDHLPALGVKRSLLT